MNDETNDTALYTHVPHPHAHRNANAAHHAARRQSFNGRLADWITARVGTMVCAYVFALLGIGTLLAVFGVFGPLSPFVAAVGGAVSSYFLQLVLLPTIMVGQNRQGAHMELLVEEQFKTGQNTYHDIEQVMAHLDAQDAALVEMGKRSLQILEHLEKPPTRRGGLVPMKQKKPSAAAARADTGI